MKRLLLLIFSIALFCYSAEAQTDTLSVDNATDSTSIKLESDSIASVTGDTVIIEKPKFMRPSFVFDYGKSIVNVAGLEQKFEAGLSFLFYDQFYLTGEYGSAVLQPENALENGNYTSEGNYFRVGGGYLTNLDQKSKLGLGIMYAQSGFEDRGDILVKSATGVQEDYQRSFENKNMQARWLEVVITSESKLRLNKSQPESAINDLFSLGFFLRLRLLSYYESRAPIDVYSIPGFGRVVNDPVPAINLYLRFHPF